MAANSQRYLDKSAHPGQVGFPSSPPHRPTRWLSLTLPPTVDLSPASLLILSFQCGFWPISKRVNSLVGNIQQQLTTGLHLPQRQLLPSYSGALAPSRGQPGNSQPSIVTLLPTFSPPELCM